MTDTTQVTDQCAIRWGAGVSSEVRAAFLARVAKLGKTGRRRAYVANHVKAREVAEGRGLRAILAPDSDPGASPEGRWIVRIYYRSMGGETLACQTGPISAAAAYHLECEYGSHSPSDALGTDRFRADQPGKIPPLWSGARLVSCASADGSGRFVGLPSQIGEIGEPATITVAPTDEPDEPAPDGSNATAAFEIPAETVTPPPLRMPMRYYREAMARRAARAWAKAA
jgi:hypothetical protein